MDVSNSIHLAQINLMVPLRVAAELAVSLPITIKVGIPNMHRAHLSADIDLLSLIGPFEPGLIREIITLYGSGG